MTTKAKGVSPQTGADLTSDMTREEASEIYDQAGEEYDSQGFGEPESERTLSDIAEDVGVDTISGPSEDDYGMDAEDAAEMSASELYDQAGQETSAVKNDGYEVFGIAERLKSYCLEVGVDIVDEDTGYADNSFRRDRTGETASEPLGDAFESEGLFERILG